MEGVPAIYLGQIVDKKHFRTFVYRMDGSQKLVESWDEYEKHMESGLWFSTKEDAMTRIPVQKPKRKSKSVISQQCIDEDFPEKPTDSDDFLPKEST